MEGVMMRNKNAYAVAVRRPDHEIEVKKGTSESIADRHAICRLPIIRGVVSFVESLTVGMKTLSYSSSFYEEEEEPGKTEQFLNRIFGDKTDSVLMGVTMVLSVILAVGIFMALPFVLSNLLRKVISSYTVRTLIEGVIRVAIFLIYILLISRMEDIQRTFMYHGAEHKCINCIEHGLPLTVENVRKSSRQHKRCGTSFLFFVLAISILLLLVVRVESPVMRVFVRIALLPVIAGISYEILRLAGRSENPLINLLSKPGLAIQKMTTKEPDDGMIEVAIEAVEAVFDWRAYEEENFHTSADI